MAYQSPSTAFSGSNWSPMGLFGSAFKQATGQTSIMGSQAVSPASKVAPPVNTIPTSQTQPSGQSTLQKIVPSATPVNTGSKGLLAPGQTTTQGNQASPQPVAPVAPTAPSTPAAPVQPTGVSSYQQGLNADATASANTQALNNDSANNYQTQPASSSLGLYGQSTQNLSNTQPTTGTTNAITSSQGIANGNPQNQQGQNYANNINSSQGLLGQFAQNQTPAVTQAENAYSKFVGTTDPNAAASQAALASPESIALGRSQQLGDRLASTAQGLGSAYQAAVQGEAQQINSAQQQGNQAIQGQKNQLTGANQAGNLSNTAQSNQIGAQNDAGTLTQPQLGQYGQAYYNPQTGQMTNGSANGGGALNPINNINSIAQQIISGQISPSQGYAMGGSVANFQGALNAAIQQAQPGFNTAAAQGKYDAQQQNTTTSGTAGTTAAAQNQITRQTATTNAGSAGYQPALIAYQDVNTKLNNVNDLGNLAVNTGTLGGINPFDAKYASMALSQFRSQLSSEAQKRFDSSISTFSGAASSLLADSSGQTPTGITGLTNGVVDPNITMSALAGLVDQAKKEGAVKAGNQASQVYNYYQIMNGGTASNLPGTMSAGGITYVLTPDGTYNPLK